MPLLVVKGDKGGETVIRREVPCTMAGKSEGIRIMSLQNF